jgi:uncharacterized protein YndB with AHSA1/START domain
LAIFRCSCRSENNAGYRLERFVEFKNSGTGTTVIATLTTKTKEDLQKLLDTGVEEGFKNGTGNLEEYLERNT